MSSGRSGFPTVLESWFLNDVCFFQDSYVTVQIVTPDTDLQLFFIKCFYFVFVCYMFTFARAYVWRSEDSFWGLIVSFHHVGFWHQPWVVRLGRKQPSASDWLDKGLIVLHWIPDAPAYSLEYDWNVPWAFLFTAYSLEYDCNVPWAFLLCSSGCVVDVLLGAGHLARALYCD